MTGIWRLNVAGTVVDLSTYAHVNASTGAGMPPIENAAVNYANRNGAQFVKSILRARTLTLACTASGSSLSNLHYLRKQLIDAIKPGRTITPQPVEIHYTGAGATTICLDAYYDGGLEWGGSDGFSEAIVLRFAAYQPLWRANLSTADFTTWTATSLNMPETVAVSYCIFRNSYAGHWQNLGNTGTGEVKAIAVDRNYPGYAYFGGDFLNWDGIAAADYIVMRTGTPTGTFIALGSGLNGIVRALIIGPDGKLYAGGEFTASGATTLNRVAMWDGAAWNALGTGVDGTVRALAMDSSGNLYAGGDFANAGGSAAARIAKWNGSAWSAIGTGCNASVYALSIANDGNTVYLGGLFTNAGGVTGASYVAKLSGTTYSVLGTLTHATPAVYALAVGPDDLLYCGGLFTTASGNTVNNIARWNGSTWLPLGSGLTGTVTCLHIDDVGTLHVTSSSSPVAVASALYLQRWNGYTWRGPDCVLPTTPGVNAVASHRNSYGGLDLYYGFGVTGNATYCAQATGVTVAGTAAPRLVLKMAGLGTFRGLVNQTTGHELQGAVQVLAGDTAYIWLANEDRRAYSTLRGNQARFIQPGTDFGTFELAPAPLAASGVNAVWLHTLYASAATLYHMPQYLSFDGPATS